MTARDPSLKSRLAMHSPHAFKLGLFGPNNSSGCTMITNIPEIWSADWDDMRPLAGMADKAGLDFILPLARWKGFGGRNDYQGRTLETLSWAASVTAITENITCFSTVHVPLFHPLVAAKQMVMADLVGKGRFGLNIVCGWNEDEFEMFGLQMRNHEDRYAYAQEWIDIVLRSWGPEEEFDFEGAYFKLRGVRSKPKPYGGTRPIFMNAGLSPTGRDFAARNCDALFSPVREENMAEDAGAVTALKRKAAAIGRNVEVFTAGSVVCRPTRKEAEDFIQYCLDHADRDAAEKMLALQGVKLHEMSKDEREKALRRRALGMGGAPIAGTPDDIVEWLKRLHDAGLRGFGIALVNYLSELPYIFEEVVPRLERLGLRMKS